MDIIQWLMQWYAHNCDGDWEHMFGVEIKSQDSFNGWAVKIDLDDTELEDKIFSEIDIKNSESNWLKCIVESDIRGCRFIGQGDADKLEEILNIFRQWAEECKAHL